MFDAVYGIMTMYDNYEQRRVSNTKEDDWEVDTAMVTDRSYVYETAVRHPDFHYNSWIIVAGVSNVEEAKRVHNEWVERMRNNPKVIYDIYDCVEYEKKE